MLHINTKDLAVMTPFRSFMVYVFYHRLNVNISLHIFHSIIHHSRITTRWRVHMLYCYIITSLLAALGVSVTIGNIEPLSDLFDKIGFRQLILAKIGKGYEVVVFTNRTG